MIKKLIFCITVFVVNPAFSEIAIGTGAVKSIYQNNCASCHGDGLKGGSASSLIDGNWQFGSDEKSITNNISSGIPKAGMPAFAGGLSAEEIRSLVVYLKEQHYLAGADNRKEKLRPTENVFSSKHHKFSLEKIAETDSAFWGMDFLPDGSLLATQKSGKLWHIKDGKKFEIIGLPQIWFKGQGGLLDIAVHPDYGTNQWIYLAFSQHTGAMQNGEKAGDTAIVRGKINGNNWIAEQTIYQSPEEFHSSKPFHFGTRLVFHDGYLYFGIGDRGTQDQAQDLTRQNGKIHRIFDDGRIPPDNPFNADKNAYPTIWTYGNRNPQGLILRPGTSEIWESEHGPRGGDEINIIEKGINYGWPVITYGMNYNGSPITDKTEMDGMAQPKHYWTPSIATSGIAFYTGDKFANWTGNLFVGGMSSQTIQRLVIKDNKVIEDETILKGQGRVRDVANGPDGFLYAIVNAGERGQIFRLKPQVVVE